MSQMSSALVLVLVLVQTAARCVVLWKQNKHDHVGKVDVDVRYHFVSADPAVETQM